MSPELKEFYRAIQAWIDAGFPEDFDFDRGRALCSTVENWGGFDIRYEMQDQFKQAGLDETYPFGGEDVWDQELDTETFYSNPDRLAWIKEHAQ